MTVLLTFIAEQIHHRRRQTARSHAAFILKSVTRHSDIINTWVYVRDLNNRKMPWVEAMRGDGAGTGALEFGVSVEIQIWCRSFESKCVADIM